MLTQQLIWIHLWLSRIIPKETPTCLGLSKIEYRSTRNILALQQWVSSSPISSQLILSRDGPSSWSRYFRGKVLFPRRRQAMQMRFYGKSFLGWLSPNWRLSFWESFSWNSMKVYGRRYKYSEDSDDWRVGVNKYASSGIAIGHNWLKSHMTQLPL